MTAHLLPCAIAFAGMALFYWIYTHGTFPPNKSGRHESYQALTFKGLATLCTALLGTYGFFHTPSLPHFFLTAGLWICTVADVALGIHFMLGMGLFGLGHIFFSLGFGLETPPNLFSLAAFAAFSGGCLGALPWLKKHLKEQSVWPYLAYGLMLGIMLSLALNQTPLLLAGAMLFVASDLLLAGRVIAHIRSGWYSRLSLALYYLAQFFLSSALLNH